MQSLTAQTATARFNYSGWTSDENTHYQCSPGSLIQFTLRNGQGVLNDTGALVVKTGRFTGRSPKDKFIVKDAYTENTIFWNEFNIPLDEKYFDEVYDQMMLFVQGKELWIRDAIVCADNANKLNIRVINDNAWSNLFVHNMFLKPTENELQYLEPEWLILQISTFKGIPETNGIRSENFCIINFSKKIILIGGTGYTGEIKKSMFTVLNFLLPHEKEILSMHCSANIGRDNDTALFFGLSGTGKTTLSADENRRLIGDDEHGWSDEGVFNFEGGCYAKCIHLDKEKEPQIYSAVRSGALVENVTFVDGTDIIDFGSSQITENTRVSYPINFVPNAATPSLGDHPKNIFLLTCDAHGILPPVSRLDIKQAMYYFLSGYTAKVAGTEDGIREPVSTFSSCFGAPFLPLSPFTYAALLENRLLSSKARVWLINTGWTGGPYGIGKRISLKHTRAVIKAIFTNQLDEVEYQTHPIFGMAFPLTCPDVPARILNPQNTWPDGELYLLKAKELALKFIENFDKHQDHGYAMLKSSGPVVKI